jgi:DNA-binding MarR family transcriptional regulator
MTDDVRWLDGDEQVSWRSFLGGWKSLEHRLDQDLKTAYGITLDDYEILVHLSDVEEHRLRMSDLATNLMASRSRLTYRVDRLEKAGLVVRRPCSEDGRSIWAVMTDEGRRVLEAAAPLHVSAVRELLIDRFAPDEFTLVGERFAAVAQAITEDDA